jgi:hypothetical protein
LPEINSEALGIRNNINTKEYNYKEDFRDYINSLEIDDNGKYSLSSLVQLIRTANNIKYIDPEF